MAIGSPAEYSAEVAAVGSRETIVDAVVGTFDSLRWAYTENELGDCVVQMPMNPISWGESVTVAVGDGAVTVKSICRWPLHVVDRGQNRRNVDQCARVRQRKPLPPLLF